MLRIAVLDDEIAFLNQCNVNIPLLLEKNKIAGELILTTTKASELLDKITSHKINVCILDINLKNEISGMHVASLIRKSNLPCEIIFLTGRLEYIRNAFDVQAYDFIPKPGWNDLDKCLKKLAIEVHSRYYSRNFIDLKCGSEVFFINYDDMVTAAHENGKTVVKCKNGIYTTYESLKDLIQRIPDKKLIQCHRSIYVNLNHVMSIDIKKRLLTMKDGSICDIGPKFYKNLAGL